MKATVELTIGLSGNRLRFALAGLQSLWPWNKKITISASNVEMRERKPNNPTDEETKG